MKRVQINKGYVGLVFKRGDYQRVLNEGKYWLGFSETVTLFNKALAYSTSTTFEIMLQDEELVAMLDIVEVKDNEIVIVYENDIFKTVYTAGRYVYWKGLINRKFQIIDISKTKLIDEINKSLLSKAGITRFIRVFEVASYEKAILLIDGNFEKILDSGVYNYWKNTTKINFLKADMRQLQIDVSGQDLLTKDKAAIRINFYTQYQVIDIKKALLENRLFEQQLYIALQLSLRKYVGTLTLDELLEQKESIAKSVFDSVQEMANKLGVKILYSGIRDIILTGDMKEIMNQVLVAQKRAQANTITRREETASTRSLLNTAKLMEENEMLFKLKEMEYVEKIADKIGEITVSGNGGMVKQLKEIFAV